MSEEIRGEGYWKVWEWPTPSRGMVTSILPYAIPPNAALNLEDVYLDQGVVRRRWGWAKVGSSLDSKVVRIFRVFDPEGNERLFALTENRLWEYTTNLGWVQRGTGFTSALNRPVTTTVHVNGKLYIANGKDNLYEFDLTTNTGTFLTDRGYLKPMAVASVAGRLVMFNVEYSGARKPNWVVYSDPFGNFSPTENVGVIQLADQDDYIQTVVTLKDNVIIRRRKSIWLMQPTSEVLTDVTGGVVVATPLVFRFERVLAEDTCESPRTLISYGDEVLFVSGRELRRLRAGLADNILPVGASLSPLLEDLSDAELSLLNTGADPKNQVMFVSVPFPAMGPSDKCFVLRLSLRSPSEPQLVRIPGRRVFAIGFGTVTLPGVTFAALGTFLSLQGITFRMLGGGAVSSSLFGVDNDVFVETTSFADSSGPTKAKWVTGLSNFGSPWYKVLERVVVLVKRGDGNLKIRVGRSMDGSSIEWSSPQQKSISEGRQVIFDWSLPEALLWAVELESPGLTDLQIGGILGFWRPSSPGPLG